MPTLFDDVYNQYLDMSDDTDIKSYTTDYSYKVLFDYLKYSISIFGDYCYKNLNDIVPFQRQTYEFKGDGVAKDFILNPVPSTGCSFYINVDDQQVTNFTFDSVNNKITFTKAPNLNSDIYIGAYVIGQFNSDLNVQEINLLFDGMVIAFKKEKLNKTRLMNQLVYSKDYQTASQANHIKEVRESINNELEQLNKKIINYTWKQKSSDMINKLHG